MDGTAGVRMVPSRFSMKKAPATRSARLRWRASPTVPPPSPSIAPHGRWAASDDGARQDRMSSTTSADGTRIDFERWGTGDAVIFLGGATQFRRMNPPTDRIAQLVADQGLTGLVYDRRGRGGSGDTPPWSQDREVE